MWPYCTGLIKKPAIKWRIPFTLLDGLHCSSILLNDSWFQTALACILWENTSNMYAWVSVKYLLLGNTYSSSYSDSGGVNQTKL